MGERTAERLGSLDGLRGIAACAVLAYHYGLKLGGDPMHYGLLGVDLFFVISGYVIFLTLARRPNVVRFAKGRVARLFPAYWASVLFAAAVYIPRGEASVAQSLVNLTMLQRFVGVNDVMNVYWTLAYELWFYVLISLAFATGAIKRIELPCLAWLLGMAGIRITEATLFDGCLPGSSKSIEESITLPTMVHYGHLFIVGMMLFRLRSGAGWLSGTTLAVALAYALFGRSDWSEVRAVIYFPLVCTFTALVWDATGSNRLGNALSASAMRFLGSISYSLYLTHAAVVSVALLVMPSAVLAVAVATPASILIAWGVRRYIEVPGQAVIDPRRVGQDIGHDGFTSRKPSELAT